MNAVRQRVETTPLAIENLLPVSAASAVAAAASPARMLQQRLEEAALRSFYAPAAESCPTPFSAAPLRKVCAMGAGLLAWGGILAITVRLI